MDIEKIKQLMDEHVTADPNGCWLWNKKMTRYGYIQVIFKGKWWRAHRLFYTAFRGEIPKDLVLDHLCNVKHCINPWHLEAVTDEVNIKRSPRYNSNKTHCTRGHAYDEENTHIYVYKGWKARVCKKCQKFRTKRRAEREKLSRPVMS